MTERGGFVSTAVRRGGPQQLAGLRGARSGAREDSRASAGVCRSAIFEFNRRIVDATAEYACCFKPQFAHYAALGAEDQLLATIRLHPREASRPAGDPGFQARRHRQHCGEIRAGVLRALRRGCRDGESVSGLRFDRAVSEVDGPRRDHPVPHLQPRRARFPGSGGRRQAAVPARGRARGARLERGRPTACW